MERIPLWVAFTIASILAVSSAYLNLLPLYFFAPPLILVIYRKPLPRSMLVAFVVGLFIDLLSGQMRLGIVSFQYVFTVFLLFRLSRIVIGDHFLTLSIMSALFSFIMTSTTFLAHALILKVSNDRSTVLFDLFAMPLIEFIYALFCFSVPEKLWKLFWIGRKRRRVARF